MLHFLLLLLLLYRLKVIAIRSVYMISLHILQSPRICCPCRFVCFEIFFYWLNLSDYVVMMINFTHYIQFHRDAHGSE